jgi:hypothetical protein
MATSSQPVKSWKKLVSLEVEKGRVFAGRAQKSPNFPNPGINVGGRAGSQNADWLLPNGLPDWLTVCVSAWRNKVAKPEEEEEEEEGGVQGWN